MGTKNKPGAFDCYTNAHPDEPMFILLGRDRMAPALVREWARMRRVAGENEDKVAEAEACATAMEHWAIQTGKIGTVPVTLADVAESAAWELLNVDASMKERAFLAEKLMRALGLPWPPPRAKHEFDNEGACLNCGIARDDCCDLVDGEFCE